MREDLLFHITTEDQWERYKKDGRYRPESLDEEGFIHCSSGHQVEKIANRIFSGTKEILLVVIDTARLGESIKYEKDTVNGEEFPHLYDELDVGAVIERIKVGAEDNGAFKIAFSSDS